MTPLGDPVASNDGHGLLRRTGEARRAVQRVRRDAQVVLERARDLHPSLTKLAPADVIVLLAFDVLLDPDRVSDDTPEEQAPIARTVVELSGYDDSAVSDSVLKLRELRLIEYTQGKYPKRYRGRNFHRLTDDGRFVLGELFPRHPTPP